MNRRRAAGFAPGRPLWSAGLLVVQADVVEGDRPGGLEVRWTEAAQDDPESGDTARHREPLLEDLEAARQRRHGDELDRVEQLAGGAEVREPDRLADRAALARLAEAASAPAALCPGPSDLKARIGELWVDYKPRGERWKWDTTSGRRGVRNRPTPREQRWLWKALLPFHERLPTISVFLVDYPASVLMAVPPTACLIAPAGTSADYARQVVAAADQLAAAR